MTRTIGITSLALALMASPALAVDGVLEINQTCAVLTGCFAGDTPGFPVVIDSTTPGKSFRLTSDLVVPDTNPGGILLQFSLDGGVAIDLNGFMIVRAACLVGGASISCMPTSGSLGGVDDDGNSVAGHSVRNGSVVGMGLHGVRLTVNGEVTNVRTRWNRQIGIAVGGGSTISDNTSYQNGTEGIIGVRSVIRNNAVNGNLGDGIQAVGSTISGNSVSQNGGDGIVDFAGSLIERNAVRLNTGFGLQVASDTAYHANNISGNTGGTVTGVGVDLGANACDGAATCP